MRTLQIADNSPEAIRFLEFAKDLPFVKETVDRRVPPCRYTVEELHERIDIAMEDLRAGRTITSEELRKKAASW